MGISRVLPVALLLAGLGDLPPPPGPRYDATGALILPDGLDRWILVGSSLGLGYADPTDRGAGMFHQVYLAPRAYDAVRRTGRFPPGTMFALVAAPPGARGTPARQGVYAETPVRVELAVKDPARFKEGWAYFDFGPGRPGATARPLPRARCERCHAEHGARDHVFVQFYPRLRDATAGVRP